METHCFEILDLDVVAQVVYDRRMEQDDCEMCGGTLGVLGTLGRTVWLQCRACGWEQSQSDDLDSASSSVVQSQYGVTREFVAKHYVTAEEAEDALADEEDALWDLTRRQ